MVFCNLQHIAGRYWITVSFSNIVSAGAELHTVYFTNTKPLQKEAYQTTKDRNWFRINSQEWYLLFWHLCFSYVKLVLSFVACEFTRFSQAFLLGVVCKKDVSILFKHHPHKTTPNGMAGILAIASTQGRNHNLASSVMRGVQSFDFYVQLWFLWIRWWIVDKRYRFPSWTVWTTECHCFN